MRAGEKKDLSRFSVGNIVASKRARKKKGEVDMSTWPKWAKTVGTDFYDRKSIHQMRRMGESWSDIEGEFEIPSKKKKRKKGKRALLEVKRRLKATKRAGKKRTKKDLLQDTLDL